jgi:hypothetical protein
MKPGRLAAFLAAVVLVGCARTPTGTNAVPDDLVGCYQLELGEWSGPHEAWPPPGVVMLMDSLGTSPLESGRHLIRPCPGDTLVMHYKAWWERPAGDSLRVTFTTGYVGILGRLRWDGARWTGRAEAFTDVDPFVQATATIGLTAAGALPLRRIRAGGHLTAAFTWRAAPSRPWRGSQ